MKEYFFPPPRILNGAVKTWCHIKAGKEKRRQDSHPTAFHISAVNIVAPDPILLEALPPGCL